MKNEEVRKKMNIKETIKEWLTKRELKCYLKELVTDEVVGGSEEMESFDKKERKSWGCIESIWIEEILCTDMAGGCFRAVGGERRSSEEINRICGRKWPTLNQREIEI